MNARLAGWRSWYWGVWGGSSVGRAPDLHSGGRGFKSHPLHSAGVVRDQQGRIVLTCDHKDAVDGWPAYVSIDDGLIWQEEKSFILC